MLGIQNSFVRNITQHGFKLVGQAVVRFKFDDPVSINILKKYELDKLPEGYTITDWNNDYFEQTAQVIHESFKDASDSKFDPRFLTLEGSKDIVNKIVQSIYGTFLPESTKVLLYQNNVAGICFANITAAPIANIPLIGIIQEHKKKGFGKHLLKMAMESTIKGILEGKIIASEINASVETDNYPALRMYRKVGFKEDYTYPHAFFEK
jgi:ribosomal protein S18 acetylase RimI-like enzyme